jgi:hypothetical protein
MGTNKKVFKKGKWRIATKSMKQHCPSQNVLSETVLKDLSVLTKKHFTHVNQAFSLLSSTLKNAEFINPLFENICISSAICY